MVDTGGPNIWSINLCFSPTNTCELRPNNSFKTNMKAVQSIHPE